MGKIIELSHDDVQNELAYALICETMEGCILEFRAQTPHVQQSLYAQ